MTGPAKPLRDYQTHAKGHDMKTLTEGLGIGNEPMPTLPADENVRPEVPQDDMPRADGNGPEALGETGGNFAEGKSLDEGRPEQFPVGKQLYDKKGE